MTTPNRPSREQMRDVVDRYLSAIAEGTPEQIAALYAPDATVEDPVGTAAHEGRDAIAAFYRPLAVLRRRTRLLDFRAAGSTAAFRFEVTVSAAGKTITTAPIDVMTFDGGGRITSMRAIWSSDDVHADDTGENQ